MPKPNTFGSLALKSSKDIFKSTVTRADGEQVVEIALSELHAPDCHPFRINDDEQMKQLVESVKRFGVREPGLVRPHADGGYELLCGNRRKRACQLVELDKMPVIVRELDDDLAVIVMVDSNLQQREKILPSERVFAYKMKMDALNHNGVKADKHSCEIMAEQTGESVGRIFRFIRLTELVETLLDMVDSRQLAMTPAVELSHLSYDEQHIVASCMAKYEIKPSFSQAVKLHKMRKNGTLTETVIDKILSEAKGLAAPPKSKEEKGLNRFKRFFPTEYTAVQMSEVITKLLTEWKDKAAIL